METKFSPVGMEQLSLFPEESICSSEARPVKGSLSQVKEGGGNDLRSALCFTYIRLLETMRPRWFVWENVPGVFSTNGGNDFREFIRRIDEVGYSVAWRVLDAQYVRVDGYPRAVPQRRRRVFVVGHIGADWQYPASVLFEPDSLFRDTPPRRVKGKGFTGNIENRSGMADRTWDPSGVNPTINQCNAGSGMIGASNQELFSQNMNGLVMESQYGNIAGTLEARHDSSPCADRGQNIVYAAHETGQGFWQPGETSGTLRAEGENRPSRPSNIIYAAGFNGEAGEKARGIAFEKEVCPTHGAEKPVPDAVCVHGSQDPICNSERANAVNRNRELENCIAQIEKRRTEDVAIAVALSKCADILCGNDQTVFSIGNGDGSTVNTITGDHGNRITDYTPVVLQEQNFGLVRRLMPIECERLMGFPDNWTRIPWRGKPAEDCPDGPRYKACGNSMCVNVMRWIGMRIELAERKKI